MYIAYCEYVEQGVGRVEYISISANEESAKKLLMNTYDYLELMHIKCILYSERTKHMKKLIPSYVKDYIRREYVGFNWVSCFRCL